MKHSLIQFGTIPTNLLDPTKVGEAREKSRYSETDNLLESAANIFNRVYSFLPPGDREQLLKSIQERAWLHADHKSEPVTYEADGYKLRITADNDVIVEQSPYYTQCCQSGMAPAPLGQSWAHGGVRTYCLGSEWFTDGLPPYQVYSVANGNRMMSDQEWEEYQTDELQRDAEEERANRRRKLALRESADHSAWRGTQMARA